MAEAADLGAENGVVAGYLGGEVDVGIPARNGVLFQAHLRDGKSVNDILRAEGEVNLAAGRKDELTAYEIVVTVGVAGIDAERVTGSGVDEREAGVAEGGIPAGVAEVPDELHAGDLDLHGGGVGAGVALLGPKVLRAQAEPREKQCERGQRDVFQGELMNGARGAAAEDESGEEEYVHQRKQH